MAIASTVIGIPIDEAYLRRMPEYEHKPAITIGDMAKVARERQTDEGKETNCKEVLEALKKEYGDEESTMCMVYNATGAELTYVLHHDWCGHVYKNPYPILIKNGQWGAWLHASVRGADEGSSGAVVYRGYSTLSKPMDWLQSWEIEEKPGDNMVHTEVREAGHYARADWHYLYNSLTSQKSTDVYDGCSSEATISMEGLFIAIMSSGLIRPNK